MRARAGRAAVVVVTLSSGAAVLFGPRWLAAPGGLLLGFVLPGLALTLALFRARGQSRRALNAVERTMLAPALSLAVLVSAGLIIHVAGYPLNRFSWTSATVGVTLIALLLAELPSGGAAVRPDRRRPAGDRPLSSGTFRRLPRRAAGRLPDRALRRLPDRAIRRLPRRAARRLPDRAARRISGRPVGASEQVLDLGSAARPAYDADVEASEQIQSAPKPRTAPQTPVGPPTGRIARQLIPMALVLAILGFAGWLSLSDARRVADVTVTALSAAPPTPVAPGRRTAQITRTVLVTASGLTAGDDPYSLVVTAPHQHTAQRAVDVPGNGTWTATLALGPERTTISLYRAGDTAPYRTLYIAAQS